MQVSDLVDSSKLKYGLETEIHMVHSLPKLEQRLKEFNSQHEDPTDLKVVYYRRPFSQNNKM